MKIFHLIFIFLPIINSFDTMGIQHQPKPGSEALILDDQDKYHNCEDSVAVLDNLAQNTEPNDLIIVIARLGDGETKRNLIHRRCHNVRTYLTEYLTDRSVRRKPETILLAEGERVKGNGRIEFYVKGKLIWTLRIKRNSDLPVGYCSREPPEPPCPPIERNLYPCRDKYMKP